MAEQNVNLIVKQDERNNEEEVVISISAIFRKLKKYFMVWFMVAVIIGGLIAGGSVFFNTTSSAPVHAVVSFNYDGIEKGKNPDGTDFDWNTLKSPQIIEAALNECGLELKLLESVRRGIRIEGEIPEDSYQRLNTYKNIYENATNGQLAAAQAMLDVSWFSTQYNITFNYRESGLTRSEAVDVLNAMLNAYRDFFFKQFGYNEAMGNSLESQDYTDYDYAQAVDMFRTTLQELNRYVDSLSRDDTARFRSTVTGYTFADLKSTISSVQSLDLDLISSYLNVNNISKDKDRLQTYYEFRIQNLERQQKADEEVLEAIEKAFDSYEKDQIIIFSDSNKNTESSIASEEYDKLISQRISAQRDLSQIKSDIQYYKERLTALKNTKIGKTDKTERIEKDLEKLDKKVKDLVKLVNDTADDYYQNVSLSSAYSILVPATSDAITTVKSGLSKAIMPLAGIEAILLMFFLGYSFVTALIEETKKRKVTAAAEKEAASEKDAAAEEEKKS